MYELAFHLTPDLEVADVSARVQDIEQILTKAGASVVATKEPRRIHLSYPIAHKYYAFFTVMDVEAPPEAISIIDSQLKLQSNVLRFLMTKKPRDGKPVKMLALQRVT